MVQKGYDFTRVDRAIFLLFACRTIPLLAIGLGNHIYKYILYLSFFQPFVYIIYSHLLIIDEKVNPCEFDGDFTFSIYLGMTISAHKH